ncbi:hypothetical protein J1C52_02305 [Roseibaca sp. Y0-43]|nr:hypothetical protein [Roseibaca sp. Y0-43]
MRCPSARDKGAARRAIGGPSRGLPIGYHRLDARMSYGFGGHKALPLDE